MKPEQRIPSMIREVSPCKDCAEKYPACHGSCPKDKRGEYGYKAWADELERIKEARRQYVNGIFVRKKKHFSGRFDK